MQLFFCTYLITANLVAGTRLQDVEFDAGGELFEIDRKKRALDLAEDFNSNEIHVGDIFEFLAYEVIKKHMLEYDREYSAYISAAV